MCWEDIDRELVGIAKRRAALDARCDACATATQEGAGQQVAITHDIPAKTRRLVWERDSGKYRVPGCRATRNVEVHHLVARADGGTHDPENLLLLCNGHHDVKLTTPSPTLPALLRNLEANQSTSIRPLRPSG